MPRSGGDPFEHGWNLGWIGLRDCNAPELLSHLDFGLPPRAPIFIDPNWEDNTCPTGAQHIVTLDTTR